MGAYVSSKMAAVKILQAFAGENHHVRLHNVHPGFLDTAMSAELARTTKLPFAFDDSEWSSVRLNQSSLADMVAFV
jgi:NAD(P)-dependent dehydrogenase (short-subunit alcohol dehydrogenase family)